MGLKEQIAMETKNLMVMVHILQTICLKNKGKTKIGIKHLKTSTVRT